MLGKCWENVTIEEKKKKQGEGKVSERKIRSRKSKEGKIKRKVRRGK